jgi:hypothetical protein
MGNTPCDFKWSLDATSCSRLTANMMKVRRLENGQYTELGKQDTSALQVVASLAPYNAQLYFIS